MELELWIWAVWNTRNRWQLHWTGGYMVKISVDPAFDAISVRLSEDLDAPLCIYSYLQRNQTSFRYSNDNPICPARIISHTMFPKLI
jgi:hypothetical protein